MPPPSGGAGQARGCRRVDYTLDFSVAYPSATSARTETDGCRAAPMPSSGTAFDPTTRLVANFYDLQHYPVGFNSGTSSAVSAVRLSALTGRESELCGLERQDSPRARASLRKSTSRRKTSSRCSCFEKLFYVGNFKGRRCPIVISPTYVSRWSRSPLRTETATSYRSSICRRCAALQHQHAHGAGIFARVHAPFLKTPKMFGTFTVAPTWLVHTAGLEPGKSRRSSIRSFIWNTRRQRARRSSSSRRARAIICPTDPYAQHLDAYFLGVSQWSASTDSCKSCSTAAVRRTTDRTASNR